MLKLSKTAASSVSTATLSDDELTVSPQEQLLVRRLPVDWTTPGGTPFSKLLECCLPRDPEEDSHEEEVMEEPWVRPPMEEIETKERDIDNIDELPRSHPPPLFDACIVLQMALLGGFLAMQVVSAM